MAPGYGQYNNYYDPVGSQANNPQNYSYQSAATSASQPTTAAYSAPSYPSYGSNAYSGQQYGSGASGQQSGARTASAATGTGTTGMGGQDNQASGSRTNSTQQHESGSGSWGNPNYTSSSYSASLQPPARSQSNTSPLYASSAPSASFGRLSYNAPPTQTQSSATTYSQQGYGQQSGTQSYGAAGPSDTSRQTYGAPQPTQATVEPSRYASPLHAVQAQQHQQSRQQTHGRQASRSSNQHPSPVMNTRAPPQQTDHRQASASVEPTNTTVDPSQVYDFRAEREKKAKAEAEKRRKMEEIEAAKKAEEDRVAEEQRRADEVIRRADEAKRQAEEVKHQAAEQRANEERRRAEQAEAKAEANRKKEEQRKARESKNAANTLASMASSSNIPDPADLPPPANDEEVEMRSIFQKMREFNSKNPAMLAKLWEEERRSHAVESQSPQPSTAAQPTAPPPKPKSTSNATRKGMSSTPLSGSTSTPNQAKAYQNMGLSGSALAAPVVNAQATEPNAPQANTHLWPPGKKGLLAEIAARWLHGVNPHKVVTTTEVLERLDMNPNYVQLCESLESIGLRFERAAFARELLCGIPPASASNQTSTKVSDATIMSANGTVAQATGVTAPDASDPKPKRPRATKAEMEQRRTLSLMSTLNKQANGKASSKSNNGMVDYEMPSFTVPDDATTAGYVTHMPEQVHALAHSMQQSRPSPSFANNHSRQPSQSVQPERGSVSAAQQGRPMPVGSAQQTPEVRPPSPPREPADKEEAARKRGFGDLVDLTAGDSDDDVPPMKMVKGPQLQRQAEPHQPQQYKQTNGAGQFGKLQMGTPTVPSSGSMGPPFRTHGIPTTAQIFMQPNGSFGTAPTGTASVSATAMPTPIVPSSAAPPPKRKGPSNENLQFERVKGKMVVEPIMRDRVARRSAYDSRTIARDILLATGRHPDMRPLNGHMNVMQKLLGDRGGMLDQSGNKSDLATIKWDILDPDPPKKTGPAEKLPALRKIEPAPNVARSTEIDGEDADDEEDILPSTVLEQGAVGQSGTAREKPQFDLRNVSASATASTNNKPPKVPKKRGRPPRSSAPNGTTFTSVNSSMDMASNRTSVGAGTPRQASGQPQVTPATAPAGRASSSNAPTGTPTGYAAFRQLDESGNVVKKKGRPVGWRKNMHSREAQGLPPKTSGSSGTKSKVSVPRPEGQLQEPKYQVYQCKWLSCDAQLHSLDVLKKHVLKVHGKTDLGEEYLCMWRGCADMSDGQHATFEKMPDWLGHVDKEHLQPVAWQLGDGPRGGLSDHHDSEHSEAYLSDSRGRSVTPIIRPMSNIGIIDDSSQVLPARPGRPPAGSSKIGREAHQELQKLKERKKAVGPTLEKTGVRLANEKRRMGFLDENFEEIIESEGDAE